ncbi:MAG: SH3 domain-containing protein [Chloroflexi bacterium]|nr:SH3 domain-containing protein [Chloroflexota bacterium]
MRRAPAWQVLVALALVVIAIIGLCRVTGWTGRLAPPSPTPAATSIPMPTFTSFPTLTVTPTALSTATPTPQPLLMPGGQAVVQGTGAQQLRLRAGPGLDKEMLGTLPDDTRLKVLDGPETADGYKWWKVQTEDGLVGWVAGDWLVPIAP